MKLLKKIKLALRRPLYALTAMALMVGVVAPLLTATANAAQVQDRLIKMSSSLSGATGVTYTLSFTAETTEATPALVLEFCSNTPLMGDSCEFADGAGGTTVPDVTTAAASDGTASALSSHTLEISTMTTWNSGDPVSVDITNVTNPQTNGTFYARLYTYPSDAAAAAYVTATNSGDTPDPKTYDDYGGIALAIVNQIQVTAKVMETLSICTSGQDISGGNYGGDTSLVSCGDANAPNITIGHGSGTKVLDNTAVDMTPAYFQMSTNASQGAVVRMKASNTCANGGLSATGGNDCSAIPGIDTVNGVVTAVPSQMDAGTAAFGLYVADSVLTSNATDSTIVSSGTITPDNSYNDGTNNAQTNDYFGMPGTEVTGTYGSEIASCGGPISRVNTKMVFGATAGLTTPAGIYTANEDLIATGKF